MLLLDEVFNSKVRSSFRIDFRKARKARNPTQLDPQKGRVSGLFPKLAAGFASYY